jgi:glycosyltransferase involved in cell wall biosynthesis
LKKILTFISFYTPGFKAGGALRSVSNLVEMYGNKYEFSIITSDRDLGDEKPYSQILKGWNNVGKAKVMYLPKNIFYYLKIIYYIFTLQFDDIYFNSFFSSNFTIYPLLLSLLFTKNKPIYISPRGELEEWPLNFKKVKKKFYLVFFLFIVHSKRIIFIATNKKEKERIGKVLKNKYPIIEMLNIPELSFINSFIPYENKDLELRLAFMSRISPKKNLHNLLDSIRTVKNQKVILDIYGSFDTHESRGYEIICKQKIQMLKFNKNLRIDLKGYYNHEQFPKIISKYDYLIMPSLSENFGHVIIESILCGRKVILSKDLYITKEFQALKDCFIFFEDFENIETLVVKLIEEKDFAKIKNYSAVMNKFLDEFYKRPSFFYN